MSLTIIADSRWIAPHGLGRFAKEVIDRLPNAQHLTGGPPLLSAIEPFWLSWEISRQRPSVYFSPGFNPPLYSPVPFVFTIGDLIHLHVAEETSRAKRAYYSLLVKPAIKRSHAVVTFSEYSKQQIVEWSGVSPDHIRVVWCGVSPEFSPEGSKFDPGFPYLFYIGNAKPHKNAKRLLAAFAQANIPKEIKLIIRIGGAQNNEFAEEAQWLGIIDRVIFTGLIPDAELPNYYRGAVALVFPTLYEGFGLPPLEAMASGTPVVTSNTTSLPEVVGDAAVLVDPLSLEHIASGIERVVLDSDLRVRLRAAGLERSKRFTWEKTAALVQETLQEAIGK